MRVSWNVYENTVASNANKQQGFLIDFTFYFLYVIIVSIMIFTIPVQEKGTDSLTSLFESYIYKTNANVFYKARQFLFKQSP